MCGRGIFVAAALTIVCVRLMPSFLASFYQVAVHE